MSDLLQRTHNVEKNSVKKILAINLGSTSTKIVYYEDDNCRYEESLPHKSDELKKFPTVWDQVDYRKKAILDFLDMHGIDLHEINVFTSRGGHTMSVVSGVYKITPLMLEQSRSEKYGNHICDVGIQLADLFAKENGKALALTVDPPVTDEFEPLARYSGLPEMPRRSSFHALNHKAAAKQFAQDTGKKYEELNVIVCHMGGGTSCAAHKKGRMVDGTNGLEGDGPFSTNRSGALPVGALIEACYSGKYTLTEMHRKVNGLGGMMAYVNESDAKLVEEKALAGDDVCREVIEAMMYQTAKEIAAMAVVMNGNVDTIIVTGGIAYSDYIIDLLRERVGFIAPLVTYPGEYEMQSLALNSYKALLGQVEIKEFEQIIGTKQGNIV
jgi:butyrate kinase